MVQYSANFQELVDLDPVLDEIFFQGYAQFTPVLRPLIYSVRESNKAKETALRVGSFGEPTEFDGQVDYDRADADYPITYSHTHYTKGFKVARTMLEDLQYEGIFDRAANLAQGFGRKQMRDEASVFENAFSTSYNGYDGKPLVSASHPRSETDSSNQSNLVTGSPALTSANLETAVTTLMGLTDDRGQEINLTPTHLVVGLNNRKKALELTGSELTPDSANNATNVHASMVTVVSRFITGNKWFVLDAAAAQASLRWYNRLLPSFMADDDMSTTLMRSYVGRMRYSFGWNDWRWVVGSNAS